MTSITIGGREIATTPPADLDAAAIKLTGCSPVELAEQLRRRGDPFQVGRALSLFTDQSASELAAQIGEEEVPALRLKVADLLVPPAPVVSPAAGVAA